MSHDDSTRWHARSKDMRARADQTNGGISKHLMQRIADDYERLAQIVADRPNRFSAIAPVVPAEVRRYAPRKNIVGALTNIELDLPNFLKQGPATTDELEHVG